MRDALPTLVGEDPVFLDAVERCSRLAPVDRPCLVVGERGTGKELFAARLHYLSPRWNATLTRVNCAALTESLLESELFGHEAGAFTGAQRRRAGIFERADGGTLILDEIADASLAVQSKVLRVIEYGEFERVGGSTTLKVDVRVIGSTNVDLPGRVASRDFRADLLDRLAFDVVTIPPLRARRRDIMLLADVFAVRAIAALGLPQFSGFTDAARQVLLEHTWPGNVRELRNVVERSVFEADVDKTPVSRIIIDPFDSPHRPGGTADPAPERAASEANALPTGGFRASVANLERRLLDRALAVSRHNQAAAARHLELDYHQFRRLLKRHGMQP
ncbi:MAG: phage shock protein operon transcriptional activator [Gammaproteobacteria bacterium]|nr:phage shock protein operon transcriptional activator [Gammaproteobacteria bacterium]